MSEHERIKHLPLDTLTDLMARAHPKAQQRYNAEFIRRQTLAQQQAAKAAMDNAKFTKANAYWVLLSVTVLISTLCVQIWQIQKSNRIDSARFITEINQQLNDKRLADIAHAVNGGYDYTRKTDTGLHDSNYPIMIQTGGRFTWGQVDDYLDLYETVGELYEDGLIDGMAQTQFYYNVGKLWCNKDITKYITDMRTRSHDDYYSGLETLAHSILGKSTAPECAKLDKE